MDFKTSLIIIVIAAFAISSIWNIFSLKDLKKRSRSNRNLDDPKYYELKSKYEFLLAIFAIIITGASILGYNSLADVKKAMSEDFKHSADSTYQIIRKITARADSLNNELITNQKRLSTFSLSIQKLSSIEIENFEKGKMYENQVNKLSQKISHIDSSNILKKVYYRVDSLSFFATSNSPLKLFNKYAFSNLITDNGDRLPKFKTPPFISIVPYPKHPYMNFPFKAYNITKDSFYVYGATGGYRIYFDILIFDN